MSNCIKYLLKAGFNRNTVDTLPTLDLCVGDFISVISYDEDREEEFEWKGIIGYPLGVSHQFGDGWSLKIYQIMHEPIKGHMNGKIMHYVFLDSRRLYSITDRINLSWFLDSDGSKFITPRRGSVVNHRGPGVNRGGLGRGRKRIKPVTIDSLDSARTTDSVHTTDSVTTVDTWLVQDAESGEEHDNHSDDDTEDDPSPNGSEVDETDNPDYISKEEREEIQDIKDDSRITLQQYQRGVRNPPNPTLQAMKRKPGELWCVICQHPWIRWSFSLKQRRMDDDEKRYCLSHKGHKNPMGTW